jgi:hypothetical protein
MLRVVSKSVIAILVIGSVGHAESFPYTAYVTLDSSSVRSGPGDNFYPTSRLRWAELVEVYRHDAQDWAAIRPPLTSFSWVPAAAIEVSTDDPSVGRVTKPNLKTRIGSNINEKHRGVEYIELMVGESVAILANEDRQGTEWLRVAPPAGEFRWIRLSDISKDDPTIEEETPEVELALAPIDPASDSVETMELAEADSGTNKIVLQQAQFSEEPLPPAEISPPLAGIPSNFSQVPGTVESPDAYLNGQIVPGEPTMGAVAPYGFEGGSPGGFTQLPPRPVSGLPPRPSAMIKPGPVAKKLLANELADIELQLSLTVSQPAAAWDMAPLRIRTQAVIDTSDDPDVRVRANGLLSKVSQFADIQRRQTSVDAEAWQVAQSVGGPSVLASTYGGGTAYGDPWMGSGYAGETVAMGNGYPIAADGFPVVDGGSTYGNQSAFAASSAYNYDGTGWLMPVVTDRNDMPKYVLTDSKGDILQFVSPSPGLNLKEYETKQVGIIGSKNRLKETNQPHIVADRVITLEKVRR